MTDSSERLTLYTTADCPRCERAKRLLAQAGHRWREVRIDQDRRALREYARVARGARTVPQLALDGRLVGDLEVIEALHREGRLAGLLST